MRASLAVVVVLAACGGGGAADQAVGVYQVVGHTANDAGCTEGSPVPDPAFFAVDYFGTVDGVRSYSISGCTSSDESTCEDVLAFVSDSPNGGLFSFFQSAVPIGTDCILDYITYEGVRIDETFEFHTTTYEDTVSPAATCVPDDAGARGDTMPCIAVEHMIGMRL